MGKNYKSVSVMLGLSLALFSSIAQEKEQKEDNTFHQPPNIIILDTVNPSDLKSSGNIFDQYLKLNQGNSFVSLSNTKDNLNITHQKFRQHYKGVKVEFGTAVIDVNKGQTISLHGEYYNVKGIDTSPKLSRDQAFNYAIQHTGAEKYLWDYPEAAKAMDNYQAGGELVILPNLDSKNASGVTTEFNLVYKFDIYATKPLSRGDLYIDANTGEAKFFNATIRHVTTSEHAEKSAVTVHSESSVLEKNNAYESFMFVTGSAQTKYSGTRNIETTFTSGRYTLNDSGRKIYTRDAKNQGSIDSFPFINNYDEFTDNDNNWTTAEHRANKDNAALDAHWGAAKTYDYFAAVHNRNSFDNRGGQIRNYVHVGNNYNNAFWNGTVMSYGDGDSNGNEGNGRFDALTSLDVTAHEIVHAVTENTADLAYQRESGALSEGFSDIFGAAVEHYTKGNGSDSAPGSKIWLIGDEIDRRTNSPGSRSMSNPTSLGKPDTYGGQYWMNPNCGTPNNTNDDCYVHRNSGVMIYWFYLTVMSGSGTNDVGNRYRVSGIGMSKSEKIAYRTLNVYLTPNSTYADARTASIQATKDLYGAGGAEEKAVTNAWYAVNVGDAYVEISQGDTQAPSIPTRLTTSNITETTLTLSWNASNDNVAVTSYEVYRNSTKLGNISQTSANITGLTKNTTYQFRVKATDAAGNISDFSSVLSAKTSVGSTGGGGSGCNSATSSFPYSEGYENTLGAWTQSSSDDTNWVVNRSGTPSSGTGPTSANEGSYYAFVEASGEGIGFPNKQAIINSPCYDLSNLSEAIFSFDYHMYGDSDMGSITLEASTNNGTTWSSLWSETGNKGNSWKTATIDLANYVGSSIQLRFNRITGGSWKADLAIDNVSLKQSTGGGSTNICDGVSAHSSAIAYQTGDLVTYQGNLYQRTSSSWNNIGACGNTSTFTDNSYDPKGPPTNTILSVYPNPTNKAGVLNVNTSGPKEYQIIDVLGKVVSKGIFNAIINIQKLETGIYLLKVNTQTTRFVIN